jgi:hypothetical protein
MAFKLNQKKEFDRQSITGVKVGGYKAIDVQAEKRKAQALGLKRTIGTAFSLILGGTMCYVSLHYIPAFVNPPQIIAASDFNTRAEHLKGEDQGGFLSAYIDAFNMKRAYIRKGQTVEAQYVVPEGSTLSLTIQQCQSLPVIEVFNCRVVKNRNTVIENSRSGLRSFTFPEDGFYKFSETLTGPSPDANDGKKRYVIWSRRIAGK